MYIYPNIYTQRGIYLHGKLKYWMVDPVFLVHCVKATLWQSAAIEAVPTTMLISLPTVGFYACSRKEESLTNGWIYRYASIIEMHKHGSLTWMDDQAQSAYSIAVSPNYVVCACANGVIR